MWLSLTFSLLLVVIYTSRMQCIFGGNETQIEDYPFFVLLRTLKDFYEKNSQGPRFDYCGGTILTKQWILTSANCGCDVFGKMYRMDVFYGASNISSMSMVKCTKIILHPYYVYNSSFYNLAMLKLSYDLPLGAKVKPITLPSEKINDTQFTIVGMGLLDWSSKGLSTLHAGEVGVVNANCFFMLNKDDQKNHSNNDYEKHLICLGDPAGPCQFDNGGAAVTKKYGNWMMQAIIPNKRGKVCESAHGQGIYSRVSHYVDWIKVTMENDD